MTQHPGDVPDVRPLDAYTALKEGSGVVLVDVRTRPEWVYVGLPDLTEVGAEPMLLEWQTFPDMAIDTQFGPALERACPDKATALYFLCRSGVRSLSAAREMSARGYTSVFNIADGFEGPPDKSGHRGTVAGWKAEGLPWRQT
ncbi:MAG: rhodanese-like domain-containing protein [Pseudomonadota bacterium]